jgi:hypothetical protein
MDDLPHPPSPQIVIVIRCGSEGEEVIVRMGRVWRVGGCSGMGMHPVRMMRRVCGCGLEVRGAKRVYSERLSEVSGFVRSEVKDRRKQKQKQNQKSVSEIRTRNHNQKSQSPSRLPVSGVLSSLRRNLTTLAPPIFPLPPL